jgi:hypothetical protein
LTADTRCGDPFCRLDRLLTVELTVADEHTDVINADA